MRVNQLKLAVAAAELALTAGSPVLLHEVLQEVRKVAALAARFTRPTFTGALEFRPHPSEDAVAAAIAAYGFISGKDV